MRPSATLATLDLEYSIEELKRFAAINGFEFTADDFAHLAGNQLKPSAEPITEALIQALVENDQIYLP